MERRIFLKGSLATSAILATGTALLNGTVANAAWNEKAFSEESIPKAMEAYFGSSVHVPAKNVKFKTPAVAENGLVVSIEVDASKRQDIRKVAVFVENNPRPLASSYVFEEDAVPFLKTRIKMGKTSKVLAVLETTSGQLESVEKEIKVTIGGCGG